MVLHPTVSGGSHCTPSKVLGLENTQRNKLDKVFATDQIFHLLPDMSHGPSLWAEYVKLRRRDLLTCDPAASLLVTDTKKPGCSTWCSHRC